MVWPSSAPACYKIFSSFYVYILFFTVKIVTNAWPTWDVSEGFLLERKNPYLEENLCFCFAQGSPLSDLLGARC